MTRYVDVSEMARLVSVVGLPKMLEELAGYIRADYLRWDAFEKCPRVANHSADGVIELMPASDETLYGFKYVNGHPKTPNTASARSWPLACLPKWRPAFRCRYRK